MTDLERFGYSALVLIAYGLLCWVCLRILPQRRLQGGHAEPQAATLVAYASQSGTARALAEQLAQRLSIPAVRPLTVDHWPLIQRAQRVIFVVSTYGEGEPPEMSRRLLAQIERRSNPLTHLTFAVVALGDRRYPHFCRFGHTLNELLQRHQAHPWRPLLTLDGADSMPCTSSLERCLAHLQGGAVTPLAAQSPPSTAANQPLIGILQSRICLNPDSAHPPLFLITFSLPATTQWQAGDLVSLQPFNDPGTIPRTYSIASIPNASQHQTDVASLDLVIRSHLQANGAPGVCSHWLCRTLPLGAPVQFVLRANPQFAAPAPDRPLILIGNGSGLAGLRAHWHARRQAGATRNWLIYGERDPQTDRILDEELQQLVASDHITHLQRVFSRGPHPAYVQDGLMAETERLRRWVNAGAVILVCGSRKGMASSVHQALVHVLGQACVTELQAQQRYRCDVY